MIIMNLPHYCNIQSLCSALHVYPHKYDVPLHYSGGGLPHYQHSRLGMLLHLKAVFHTCMPDMQGDLCQ